MSEYHEKPPLGVTPFWQVSMKRIKEVSEAIERYSGNCMTTEIDQIEAWGQEIVDLCGLIKKYQRNGGKDA